MSSVFCGVGSFYLDVDGCYPNILFCPRCDMGIEYKIAFPKEYSLKRHWKTLLNFWRKYNETKGIDSLVLLRRGMLCGILDPTYSRFSLRQYRRWAG
jgi:hypothetical protein